MRMLDLFCGAGGCSVGYYRSGFTKIVGVDINPQPRYPFEFMQADALATLQHLINGGRIRPDPMKDEPVYGLGDFDAIHASPPCQRYSIGRHIHTSGERHPDLVGPTRQLLMATHLPWVIENVMGAPLESAIVLCGTMFGLRVLRHRQFESSVQLVAPTHQKHPRGNLTNAGTGYSTGATGFVCVAGHNFVREAGAKAMGVEWMTDRHEVAQAIPPAYTEFIGDQLRAHIKRKAA